MGALRLATTHGWTIEELKELEKQTDDVRARQRIMSVRFVMEGYEGQEIARILVRARQAISIYIHTFEEEGMDGLLRRGTSPGKPCRLSKEQQEQLMKTIIEETPKSIGIAMESHWHTRNIQAYLVSSFDTYLSREAIRLLLHRMGLRYTRPTYQLKRADKKKQAAFQKDIHMVKKHYK
ncbi:winged helix-turn-helix domain-containing protein [Bacillus sp. CGMCC 1.16541]|uniref:helix-turn-helix domain-containing protein n=1 Tax=Bacillus sp. CGMCC 1.16541 TaxID=2185143 RepID=UPI000D725938|nr:winged helix-turn-helix domain-containing protein [Bacillus sp. CGMCC 1.16541]